MRCAARGEIPYAGEQYRRARRWQTDVEALQRYDRGLGEQMAITWEANDEDGDPLAYSLAVSGDGGETWLPIAVDPMTVTRFPAMTGFSSLGAGNASEPSFNMGRGSTLKEASCD